MKSVKLCYDGAVRQNIQNVFSCLEQKYYVSRKRVSMRSVRSANIEECVWIYMCIYDTKAYKYIVTVVRSVDIAA
jgi:hypothetical protein